MVRTKQSEILKRFNKQAGKPKSGSGDDNNGAVDKKPRKKVRFKWHTTALREIKRQQQKVDNIVPRAAMRRLISEVASREVPQAANGEGVVRATRFAPEAIEAVRAAAESVMIEHMERAYKYTLNRGKETLSSKDMRAAAGDMLREWSRQRA
jgi:histone H3/H4